MDDNFVPGTRLGLEGDNRHAWVEFVTTDGDTVRFSLHEGHPTHPTRHHAGTRVTAAISPSPTWRGQVRCELGRGGGRCRGHPQHPPPDPQATKSATVLERVCPRPSQGIQRCAA